MQHRITLMYIICICINTCKCALSYLQLYFTVKNTVKSLLDHTRSRNIEIFLPSFPLKVQSLTVELDQQLNVIYGSTKLTIEHIVALKRCHYFCCICISVYRLIIFLGFSQHRRNGRCTKSILVIGLSCQLLTLSYWRWHTYIILILQLPLHCTYVSWWIFIYSWLMFPCWPWGWIFCLQSESFQQIWMNFNQ